MNIYISLLITMAFSAFFSGMEIAFVSVDKLRFEMERKGLFIFFLFGVGKQKGLAKTEMSMCLGVEQIGRASCRERV